MTAYFTSKGLTGPSERDLAATFQRLADGLAGSPDAARIQFRLGEGQDEACWSVVVGRNKAEVRGERIEKPDFEIIASPDTWWDIARGSLAPLRAFVQGRMRVRGDIELGTRLLQRLSSPGTDRTA